MRLFIGVPVSDEIKETIRPILDGLEETGADLSISREQNLHLTIKFLGEVVSVDEVHARLATITSAPFPITLQGVDVFPGGEQMKVIWIGVKGAALISLMKETNAILDYLRKDDHELSPHLTIARVRSARKSNELRRFLQTVKNRKFGMMVVKKMVLYKSELTPEGSAYMPLAEFPLR